MKKRKLSGEVIISAIFLAAGVAVMAVSLYYGVWDRITPFKGFMPFIAGLVMAASSLVWLVQSVRSEQQRAEEDTPSNAFTKTELFWMAAVPAICIGVFLLLNFLGMHLTLAVFLLAWLKFISRYSWKKTSLYTIILSVTFYAIFTVGLQVPFPKGYFM